MKDKCLFKEAIHCYVTAIRLMPSFSSAHCNLGTLLKEQGKLEQSISHYQEAIQLNPLFADAYNNLGNAYKESNQFNEAIQSYNYAIKLRPNYSEAYCNLATSYKDNNNLLEAITLFNKALNIKSDLSEAFVNLVHTKCMICDWNAKEEDIIRLSQLLLIQLSSQTSNGSVSPISRSNTSIHTSAMTTGNRMNTSNLMPLSQIPTIQPFHALIYPFTLYEILQISQCYANKSKTIISLNDNGYIFKPKLKHARIKIGYVSSDFGNHPLSHLTQSSKFIRLSDNKIRLFLYTFAKFNILKPFFSKYSFQFIF